MPGYRPPPACVRWLDDSCVDLQLRRGLQRQSRTGTGGNHDFTTCFLLGSQLNLDHRLAGPIGGTGSREPCGRLPAGLEPRFVSRGGARGCRRPAGARQKAPQESDTLHERSCQLFAGALGQQAGAQHGAGATRLRRGRRPRASGHCFRGGAPPWRPARRARSARHRRLLCVSCSEGASADRDCVTWQAATVVTRWQPRKGCGHAD